jgi:uracil phosphoribosyltransferase
MPLDQAPASARPSIEAGLHVLPQTRQLRALHTVVRDRTASRADFAHYSGRIIRLLLESALDLLPFAPRSVETPVGRTYEGLAFAEHICGVSVIRAGESMEGELRAIIPGVRIGKILIQRDKVTKTPKFYYQNLPADLAGRQVLLLDPMLATGGTAVAAVDLLLQQGVAEENIVFVAFIAAPEGVTVLASRFPKLRIVASAIEERLNENAYMLPGIGDFGDRYFGSPV